MNKYYCTAKRGIVFEASPTTIESTDPRVSFWFNFDIYDKTKEIKYDIDGMPHIYDIPQPTQAELDSQALENAKSEKTNEINLLCKNEIISGFTSSALGNKHYYQSDELDQLNLIGVVAGNTDDMFKCGVEDADFANNSIINWSYKMHTVLQLQRVLADGKAVKSTLLQRANTLKEQVASATTVEDVKAIVW